MTIFVPPPLHYTTARSKRRREEEESPSHIVTATSISKKKKIDFHLSRMEHRLTWASKCAREGNRRMMEYYLEEAKKHASHLGIQADHWSTKIREQISVTSA